MSQLYYEDIEEGGEVSPLEKQPDTCQLVMWAGAVGDYNPIHYDQDFARARGLNGVVVHGQLAASFLGQMMTDWIGREGRLKKLSCSYKGMNYPGETLTCKGKIIRKYTGNNENFVDCSIWVENPGGERTLTGTATATLPSRISENK